MKKPTFKRSASTTCASSLMLLSALLGSSGAAAHGYVEFPPSRAFLCQKGVNTACGQAQYEPQSVGETFKGFPAGVGGAPGQGPIDGKIASGGHELFSPMDVQSATRWQLTELKERTLDFQWHYKAPHPVEKHQYFITRNGWNPNESLKRASFESTPFCQVEGDFQLPVPGTKHHCSIPEDKNGHHVILAIWSVGDTAAAFHSVADVNILAEAVLPGGWSAVGTIAAATPLLTGDKVKARAFTAAGESAAYSVEISIDNAEDAEPQNWSFKLAQQINQSQTLIRAGVRDENGDVEAIRGTNTLYAQKDSGVVRYEVQLLMKEDTDARMAVTSQQPEYVLDKGRTKVDFSMMSNRKMNVEANLFNDQNKLVGTTTAQADSGVTSLAMDIRSNPGPHTLTLVGTTLDGRTTRQDTQPVNVTGEGAGADYDFLFPEGLSEYTAGTKVLQAKTDEVFECKPFPASGYCKQYTPEANAFEPGVGEHSDVAWNKL
ncbi:MULTISPECIES: N-acetylglucosamine-binding protein GbpA [Pseudomonas]|jgi:predicted carbohydrate-binding protein with CBM5 and CBM33 domain|uniref:N-acetylglucosamine-binding protein GbpA n=1 Tax=Pseudomonas TaxID=286 RepID=UPI000BA2FA9E|nr:MULTISPECIES: N-acetylglucosamine-binding protein GbpA [Pseudomonas]MCO7625537.1 N-acetylglucosamine-binding protein GbpA [Pseudomonas fluorescens]NHW99631.1 N-acetylglucosamine-binding protein GbpA [Pseudomonas koreensis]